MCQQVSSVSHSLLRTQRFHPSLPSQLVALSLSYPGFALLLCLWVQSSLSLPFPACQHSCSHLRALPPEEYSLLYTCLVHITPPGGILPSDLRFCRAPCLHRQTTFVAQLCLASGFACSPFFLLRLVLSFLFMRASSCLMFFHVMACWTWIVPPLSQDQPCLFKEHLVHLSYSSNNMKLGEHKYVFSKNSCPKFSSVTSTV